MYSVKFVNFPLYNKNYDCLFESLAMFSYIIESKDIEKLIDKIIKLPKYQSNDDAIFYQNIIENIVKLSNKLNISESSYFDKLIHDYALNFRDIDSFARLNLSSSNRGFVDSSFLTDETVLFNSPKDSDIHIQLVNSNDHYFVLIIAGIDIYVLDSIRKTELRISENAHNILHFVYSGANETIISKLETLKHAEYKSRIYIPTPEDLVFKLYERIDTNSQNEYYSLFNQNLIEKCF